MAAHSNEAGPGSGSRETFAQGYEPGYQVMANTTTKAPVHYWESFTQNILNEGSRVSLHDGSVVTVGEVLDCGRSFERRYWWFIEDLSARLDDTFARLAKVCARNAAQNEDAKLARIPEELRPSNREGW